MLQQSLEDDLKFNAQDLEAAKRSLGETQGQLTTDTADLKMTEDALAEDTAALEDTTQDCQSKAAKFEAAVKSRSEELEALAKARTLISEKTGGAESFSYGLTQTSFLHLSRSVLSLRGGLAKFDRVGAARISCCFRDARQVVKWRRSFCQGEGFDQRDDLEAGRQGVCGRYPQGLL